jgi:hypothetical protein
MKQNDYIKTALELALEKIAAEPLAAGDTARASQRTAGQRLAAAFLRGEQTDLKNALSTLAKDVRPFIEDGMRETFLRNIVLPRTEKNLDECRRVLEWLAILAGNKGPALQLCGQAQQICEEYLSQTKQLTEQIKHELQEQARLVEQQARAQSGRDVHISPEQLPDFQKQFAAQMGQLNNYYESMLNEVKQRFLSGS